MDCVTLNKGETLESLPASYKNGYSFGGWYLDENLSEPFYKDVEIDNNIVLYAEFVVSGDGYAAVTKTSASVSDADCDAVIVLSLDTEITEANLASYLTVCDASETPISLTVSKVLGNYEVTPVDLYEPGVLYTAEVKNGARIISAGGTEIGEDVKKVSMRTKRDESEVIKLRSNVVTVDSADAFPAAENSYRIKTSAISSVQTGNIIYICNEKTPSQSRFIKVLKTDKADGQFTLVSFVDATEDEVFEDVSVYVADQPITNDFIQQATDLSKLKTALYESQGIKQFAALLSSALEASPSLNAAVNDPRYDGISLSDNAHIVSGTKLSIDGLMEGLKISATLGIAENTNFSRVIESKNWSVLTVTVEFEKTIKNKVKVKASLTFTEYMHLSMQGRKDKNGLYFSFDYAANIYSQTDIDFTVLICSVSGDDDSSSEDSSSSGDD